MSRVVLAIDTSTSAITVAVHGAGSAGPPAVLDDPRGHTEHLAPLMRALLATGRRHPGDVTDVVVGNGPGPFTGLRVGIVTGLVFAHARGIPVHGVCSLDALAQQALERVVRGRVPRGHRRAAQGGLLGPLPVDLDRAGETGRVRLTDPAVARPADLPGGRALAAHRGSRTAALPGPVPRAGRGPRRLRPESLAVVALQRLRDGVDLPVEPLYLRRPDALTTAERAKR